jgi:iron uptake system component EfeO
MRPAHLLVTASAVFVSLSALSACGKDDAASGKDAAIKVTATDPRLDQAVAAYRVYVGDQVDDTLAKTKKFAASVSAGDIAGAKAEFAASRFGWESIEPVAESFGDIDPKTDTREADLEKGQRWTGWHQIEKALWKTGSLKGEGPYADDLVKNIETLKVRVGTASITATSMANGAKELLDEVATGKITGEEDTFSHTDLSDFKANVDGAQKVFELLKPVTQERDADLTGDLTGEFARVQKLLGKYEKGDGYVSYDTVGKSQRKELSDEVNALGEPLSKLAGVVAK